VAKPPVDTYRNIQLALSAGSGAPDVSVIEDSHLAQFVKLGGLADVTDLVKPYTDQVNAYRWKPATRDGRVYAMPWDSGPVAVFYRRDVFSKAGVDPASIRTWVDYYRAATVIKQKTGLPMWPQPRARNDARLLEMLLWQQGLGYVDAQGNVILDKDPRIQRTLEFMGRFWREGLSLDTEWWQDPWYKALGGGKVATIPEAVWMGTFFRLTRPESQLQIYEKTDIFPALETTYQDPFFQEPSEYFVLMAGSVVSVLPMLLLFLLLQRHLVVGLTAGAVRE
jgi:lactose/L-arabinose transport system substrate-binding protein